ncbi:phage major capsid protein [Corallococcus sp. H22C18031201]|nr:phage major capsid protein [Corallococcus sp. H22C18031201]
MSTTNTKTKSTAAPPANTTPPLTLPPHLQRAVEVASTKAVDAAIAARASATSPPAPYTSGAKDLQLDLSAPTRQKLLYAALGLRMKSAYLERAKHFGFGGDERFKALDSFQTRVKSMGQFAGIYEQGGFFTRETMSTELVELTRPNSILLSAGVRTISNYGARLTMGTIDQGVTVYWVAEGEPPQPSAVKNGALVLQAHKLGALARISNDLLRLGTMDAAALVGQDMAAAIALELDIVGLKGEGVKRPLGIRKQMAAAQRKSSAGTSQDQRIADIDGLMQDVDKTNIPGGLRANNGFYYASTGTYYALRSMRDTGGWVFPELRNAEAPTLNGFPFLRTETLAGDKVFGFGLASQLVFGEAMPLDTQMAENGTDFSADMVTMRALTEVDYLLRYTTAFAERTNVTY